jgi:hypothetical protein
VLVLQAAGADDVELGIGPVRPLGQSGERRPLERGQLLAGQVTDQVGG